LDFSALVIGSLTPDLATCIDDWEYFSHTLSGSFVFCLPVGLLTYWIFKQIRGSLVAAFPNPHRDTLLPLCNDKRNSIVRIIISLLIGSFLHIAWDLFTHDHSWLIHQVVFLSSPIAGIPLNRIMWLFSSLGGSIVLVVTYIFWLQKTNVLWWNIPAAERRAYARWCFLLVVPLAGAIPLALHELKYTFAIGAMARYTAMYYFGSAYLTLAVAGFFFKWRTPEASR
jgi:hypothetical protein